MTIEQLRQLLADKPGDLVVTFLCPDGFEDFIENAYVIEGGMMQFLNYCVRMRLEAEQ